MPLDLTMPARRRRHARLIAAVTALIGACAEAAAEVYGPIAAAPPEQESVAVASTLLYVRVSLSAPLLLDLARDEDVARWPGAVAAEQRESERTYAARCAVAMAQDLTDPAEPDDVPGVPVPTVEQGAAMELAAAGAEVVERWRDDPAEGAALVLELAAGGEFAPAEVLDAAVDECVTAGLLALQAARTAPDPSTAAERCLEAVPYLAHAVTLASADLD